MVTSATVEQPSITSRRRHDESEFNLKEWSLKARISRENTSSRRYSASYIRSFRDDAKSLKSNFTISSTASSPGYGIRKEIDPSTYSFTNALKALQAKTVYNWEYSSPDGLALNSKWSEAERYICNPLSGEVPIECLSSKALNGRSFRQLSNRINITMSAPLIYPAHPRHFQMKPPISSTLEDDEVKTTIQEKRIGSMTKDVGTQSTQVDISSSSPSSVPTPSIEEQSIKRSEEGSGDSSLSSDKEKFEEAEVEMKETREEQEQDTKRNEQEKKKAKQQQILLWRCSRQFNAAGCFSWRSLWIKRKQREIRKPRTNNICLCHFSV